MFIDLVEKSSELCRSGKTRTVRLLRMFRSYRAILVVGWLKLRTFGSYGAKPGHA
jgi:hypothetical protein